MPIRLRCPNGHNLEVPDHFAGSVLECPLCGHDVQVGTPPAPPVATLVTASEVLPVAGPEQPPMAVLVAGPVPLPPPPPAAPRGVEDIPELSIEVEEGEPSEKRRRRKKPAAQRETISEKMQRVNLGLTFFYIKFLLMAAGIFLNFLVGFTAGLTKTGQGLMIFVLLQVLAAFAETGFSLAGGVLCCFVPRKSGLRPLAITTASLSGAPVILTLLGAIFALASPGAGFALGTVGTVIGLGGWVTFMVFLSHLARYLDDEVTAAEIMRLMVMMIAVWACALVLLVCAVAAMGKSPEARSGVLLGVGLLLLWCNIRFLGGMLNALVTMRQQIETRW